MPSGYRSAARPPSRFFCSDPGAECGSTGAREAVLVAVRLAAVRLRAYASRNVLAAVGIAVGAGVLAMTAPARQRGFAERGSSLLAADRHTLPRQAAHKRDRRPHGNNRALRRNSESKVAECRASACLCGSPRGADPRAGDESLAGVIDRSQRRAPEPRVLSRTLKPLTWSRSHNRLGWLSTRDHRFCRLCDA
jgi:hypothetical protein